MPKERTIPTNLEQTMKTYFHPLAWVKKQMEKAQKLRAAELNMARR